MQKSILWMPWVRRWKNILLTRWQWRTSSMSSYWTQKIMTPWTSLCALLWPPLLEYSTCSPLEKRRELINHLWVTRAYVPWWLSKFSHLSASQSVWILLRLALDDLDVPASVMTVSWTKPKVELNLHLRLDMVDETMRCGNHNRPHEWESWK